jgi:hypothetical protein
MSYIHFTEEQKVRAASVDLAEFLRRQGEKLIRSGPEVRMSSDHSITVRGSQWYDHAIKRGGGPISFVQEFYNLSYPEAVTRLLGGERGEVYPTAKKQEIEGRKTFALPTANRDMRRVYAYLLQRRHLSREVVNAFVRAGLIYESCELSKDRSREYHNAVFVGRDESGTARHAHKRSINDVGTAFRINVEGCDPRCSFHYTGSSDRLYVFEAPIDLLSFLTRYPRDWQEHSYAALCGTSEHVVLWMLEQNPQIQRIGLCLDHDEAGIEAAGRLEDILRETGYTAVQWFLPEHKDWNEDLKARLGLPVQEAEEHPQSIAAPEVCGRISGRIEAARLDYIEQDIPNLIDYCKTSLRLGEPERAMECMEQAAALALAVCGRELRQLGEPCTPAELAERLCRNIRPHQNRGSLRNRPTELAAQFQSVLSKAKADGIRGKAEKRSLANDWLELAAAFAKLPVKYEADQLRQQQKQAMQQEMGVM